jgi:nucleoside recognition membrane protein YjiH
LKTKKKAHSNLYRKAVVCLILFCGFFSIFSIPMGLGNALNTMMNTAYRILMDTVFYIMAIAVIAGAVSSLLTEFGVVALLNKLLSPLMKPLFGMPGASALGMVSTYLSDNPAILTLADDKKFRRFFKAYQIPALTNLGTSFGMGLIVTSFAVGMSSLLGKEVGIAAICGNSGAIIGAI